MINESGNCHRIIETKLNKPLVMSKEEHEDFNKSTICCICEKQIEKGDAKVKDHNQINGKYRGDRYQEYNLTLTLTINFYDVFHI